MTSNPAETAPEQSVRIFGVRHHGPGCAKSVLAALKEWKPDCLLVEGPPDAEEVLPILDEKGLKPPVALLVYKKDEPSRCAFYPFAVFSPEWQALKWARKNKVEARFIDLPLSHRIAIEDEEREKAAKEEEARLAEEGKAPPEESPPSGEAPQAPEAPPAPDKPASGTDGFEREEPHDADALLRSDPLRALAQAGGYSDGEEWWEQLVEARGDSSADSADLFEGVLQAMAALRERAPFRDGDADDLMEARREAFMRRRLREAQKEGFERIAVVCGAWHAPVLADPPKAKEDNALLKKLPKTKTLATWAPWTYGRLASWSGYGAGVRSPGWYHHLWEAKDHRSERWLSQVARTLREADMDASPASVIESARLADALAGLRDLPAPGLPELNEAALTVLCRGDEAPLRLIEARLVVNDRVGKVPDSAPKTPLRQDLDSERKRLRLHPEAIAKRLAKLQEKPGRMPNPDAPFPLDLDLRKELDLDRGHLLRRLNLLGVGWGKLGGSGNSQGTFRESWSLRWGPRTEVAAIEASRWGATVAGAASAKAISDAARIDRLPELTCLVDEALNADLPEASDALLRRLDDLAAVASDVSHLLGALPALAKVLRYGNVRQTDAAAVDKVLDSLVLRAAIGLPAACANLNDDAAAEMFRAIVEAHQAVNMLGQPEHLGPWREALAKLADRDNLHGLIAGRCVRLLLDGGQMDSAEAARRLGLALSMAGDPLRGAAWIEGLLKDSGAMLLHDAELWGVLNGWVSGLRGDNFQEMLPLLRRTFATFNEGERRQLGQLAKRSGRPGGLSAEKMDANFDHGRAKLALPVLMAILGPAGGKGA